MRRLPRFVVLEPHSTVRVNLELQSSACEIDVALEKPKPRRSFVVMIAHPSGHVVQRVRLSGRARLYFDPETPGEFLLVIANPMTEPIVVRLRGRDVPEIPQARLRRRKVRTRKRSRKKAGGASRSTRRPRRSPVSR